MTASGVLSVAELPLPTLLARLAAVRLRGFDGVQPYRDAEISLVAGLDPESLAPAQNYVLAPGVRRLLRLREDLLSWGLDLFALTGGAYVRTADEPELELPVLPPIIEESVEPDGSTALIVSDGQHRVFAARQLGLTISAIVVRGVPPEYPYYAYPLAGGWAEVSALEELPEQHQKKAYRQPVGYKALFRDYNGVFPGVQRQRPKSNPAHLQAGY